MKRRPFVIALAASVVAPSPVLADPGKVASLGDALRWLDRMQAAPSPRTTGAWPLGSVLEHLAQSIEMSLDGFPQPKGALFQQTVGSAAFAFFRWRGRMSHGLDEPIPGAPPLAAGTAWQPAAQRLRAAIARFEQHGGALQPHFAYGALGKADYALAHAFHIANHQDEIRLA
jgi:hypothetical protein